MCHRRETMNNSTESHTPIFYKGIRDLTNTNMCYRCDWCTTGFNQIFWLRQIAIEYYICDKCIDRYKITNENIWRLKYVENMTEWRETRVSMFFPYPIGFGDDDDV